MKKLFISIFVVLASVGIYLFSIHKEAPFCYKLYKGSSEHPNADFVLSLEEDKCFGIVMRGIVSEEKINKRWLGSAFKVLDQSLRVFEAYNADTRYMSWNKGIYSQILNLIGGQSSHIVNDNFEILIKMSLDGVNIDSSRLFKGQNYKKEGDCSKECTYTIEKFDMEKYNTTKPQIMKHRKEWVDNFKAEEKP